MRPVDSAGGRWLAGVGAAATFADDAIDAAQLPELAQAAVDDVEMGPPPTPGDEAVAAAGRAGLARARAVALFRALAEARDEIPPFEGGFGECTAALERARDAAAGDLAAVLDRYIALRRRVGAHIGSICAG
ncbi:MAG: hypothetical protein D6689_17150 [Deltaproteobacteria bacterium]|nr:MAG: hypothetical protein D6689_17150 [Deltaproteobacteria bacterium]